MFKIVFVYFLKYEEHKLKVSDQRKMNKQNQPLSNSGKIIKQCAIRISFDLLDNLFEQLFF